jgi:hypothetical protein
MNMEVAVVGAIVLASAVFLAARVVKTFASKSPGCCGGPGKKCPHCAKSKI